MGKEISRRGFVGTGAAMALGGLAATRASGAQANGNQAGPPNVLVIHTDQHRFDCLGATGNPDVRTPAIDALAEDGVRYDNHFCAYPVCTPSRYSLLSGQWVHEHQGWNNRSTLRPGTPTFANVLRNAGYRTKGVGKMHFTPAYLDVGFDEMVLSEQDGPGRWDDDYHRALRAHGLVDRNDLEDQRAEYRKNAPPEYWETFGALPSNLPPEWHSTRWIGDRAAETLQGWQGGGQLLMAGFIKPHHPFDPPPDITDAYDPDKLTLLPGWTEECLERDLELSKGYFPHTKLDKPTLRRVMAYYYATIEDIDRQVARMVDILKRKGLYDNTMVIFTSDHGEYMGFHHMLLKGNYLYDPLGKVPLIVKYPGSNRAGAVDKSLVSNTDVAPTILAQAGQPAPETMRGRDLTKGGPGPDMVFAESRMGRHAMVRTHRAKLILSDKEERSLFFDLKKDPLERTNRIGEESCRAEVGRLRAALLDWRGTLAPQRPYVDHDARRIGQSNVPPPDGRHVEAQQQYFAEKMKALQGEA